MSGRRPTSARPTPARRSTSSERRGSVSETPSRKKMEEMEHDCKMAFLVVAEDLNDNLTSKEQLRNVLNQTGRNPSNRVLDKHWRSSTDSVSFEDVLQIARQIPVTSEDDLMKAFRKIDINGDGYISNDELFKVMTTRGDKMTRREVQAIIDEVDENKDGRLDYKEFCQMMLATQEECGKIAKQRYEKRRLKQDAQSKSKTKSPKEANGSTTSLSDETSHRNSVEKQDPTGSQVSLKSTASSASKAKKSEKRSGSLASLRSPSSERPSKVENEKDKMGSQTSLRSATDRNKLTDNPASSKDKDLNVSEKDLKSSEVDKKVQEPPKKEVAKKDKEETKDQIVENPEEKDSATPVALQSTDKPISKASEPEKKDKPKAPSRSSSQTSLRSARSATKRP